MLVVWGSIAVFQVIDVNLALNNAAIVGLDAEMSGMTGAIVQNDIDQALRQAHLNPSSVSIQVTDQPTETFLRLSTTLTFPVLGATTVSATQADYAS